MAGIGEAASIIAVIQISTQIFGVCQTYYSEVKGARTDIQLLRNEVTSLQDILMNVKDLADNPGPVPLSTLDLLNQPTGPLAQCWEDLLEILAKLDPGQGPDRMKRFGLRALTWPFNSKEIGKVIAAIGRYKETFTIALSADNIMKEIHVVQNTLLADGYQQKLHRWLLPPDPSSNHNAACQKRQSKTGNWFTEGSIFSEWKITPNSFIWLYGIPGCGKTILSSNIIQDIGSECSVNPTFAIIYFYFDFNDAQKQNFEYLIRSLTAQLCTKSNMAADTLNALYSRNQDGKQQPMTDALIKTFQCMLEGFQQVYIVLDALDECKEREELLRFLETIAGWKLNKLHILATSRKEIDITETLEPLVTGQVCIQSELVSADIRTYILEKLQNDRGLKKLPGTVQSQIETTLMDGARGMFRWVVCQLDEIRKCLKPSYVEKTLKSLPKTLDDTYARILRDIDEEYRPDAFKLLQWLAYSARPLRIEELAEVVAIDLAGNSRFDPKERLRAPWDVLTICSSLVTTSYSTLDESDWSDSDLEVHEVEEVRLAHFSVKEYLISDRIRTGPASYYSIAQSADNLIAQACLIYLLQFNEAKLLDSLDIDFPLASYAAEYWPQHVREAEKEGSTTELQRLCTELLVIRKNAFRNCVRISWPEDPKRADYLLTRRAYENSISPLYYASTVGLSQSVQKLIETGTNAKACDDGEVIVTALIAASFQGHEAVVQQLLKTGVDVDSKGGGLSANSLQAASAAGHNRIFQRLLKAGADVNAQGGFYANALQAASISGHVDIVQILLNASADVNAQGGYYANAIQAASATGLDSTVEILLKAGADVNAQGGYYGNALQAASVNGRDNIVQILLKAGADVNAQGGKYYGNALQAASATGLDSTVEILLKAGADVDAQGWHKGRYWSALQAALRHKYYSTVEFLRNAGAKEAS